MLANQILALHGLEDKLRWKLKDNLVDIIDYLYQDGVLDSEINGDEWDAIHHHSLSHRQRVSELLKQICGLSGDRGERAFASLLKALRKVSMDLEEVAECIEAASESLADKGTLLPGAGLEWKSFSMIRRYALPSALRPVTRSVSGCLEIYRSHLLSICREQRWKSLLPERNTPGADIADWFVSVQALNRGHGSSGNKSITSRTGSQLGDQFSVSDPVQLLMHYPHLYESTMDVDEIEFIKSCMVVSSAGTGKTTLCRQLLGKYTRRTQSRLQEMFPFPVYIQCSDVDRLNSTHWETVLGVNDEDLKTALSEAERKLVVDYLLGHAELLLLVIDGVDEVSEGMFAVNGSKLSGVLCRERTVLKRASLFITSRSCSAATRLTSECAGLYTLAGFTEEQLKQYMVKRLGSEKGDRCVEALSEVSLSHVKEAILGVPLFAVLVAEEFDLAGKIPLNVTSLYGGYLAHAQLRWSTRRQWKPSQRWPLILVVPVLAELLAAYLRFGVVPLSTIITAIIVTIIVVSITSLYSVHAHLRRGVRRYWKPRVSKETGELDDSAVEEVDVMETCDHHSHGPREHHHRLHSRSADDHEPSQRWPFILVVPLITEILAAYLRFGEIPLTTIVTAIIITIMVAFIPSLYHALAYPAYARRPKRMMEKLSAKALEMLCLGQRSSSAAFLTPEVAGFGHSIGVLNSNERPALDDDGTAIEFDHVSYQEYLAAAHVSRHPSPVEAATQCAKRMGTGEATWPFWLFLCGLVDTRHLSAIILLVRGGTACVAAPKKLTCFLMLCLLENQSQSKAKSDHVEAAEAISGRELDLSRYHLNRLEIVGLVNVLRQISCEKLILTSCGITGDQVHLLHGQLPLIPYVKLAGNNLHCHALKYVAAEFHQSTQMKNTTLVLDLCDLSGEDGESIAHLMHFTTGISLGHSDPSAVPIIAGSLASSVNLKQLSLHNCDLPGGSGANMCRIVDLAPQLTSLVLSSNHLTTNDASQLLVRLSGSRIRLLELSNNAIDDGITTSLITFLRTAERQPPQESAGSEHEQTYTRIFLPGNDVHRSCLVSVLEGGCGAQSYVDIGPFFLKRGKVCKTSCAAALQNGAYFCRSGVNDAMASDLAEVMAQDTSLSVLNLLGNQISDEGARCLATALKANSTLQVLDLSSNKIGIRGLLALLAGMSAAPQPTRALRLAGCLVFQGVPASNPDLQSLLSQLRYPPCGNLRALVLSETGLTVEVGIKLAEALKLNKSLVMIGLGGNGLDDEFATTLAWSLDGNTTLQEVELSNSQITEVGVQQMTQSLGVQRLKCVWMQGNPCPPHWYDHPLVNARLVIQPNDLKRFLYD